MAEGSKTAKEVFKKTLPKLINTLGKEPPFTIVTASLYAKGLITEQELEAIKTKQGVERGSEVAFKLTDKIKDSDDPIACLLTICETFESDDIDNHTLKKHGASMRKSISNSTAAIDESFEYLEKQNGHLTPKMEKRINYTLKKHGASMRESISNSTAATVTIESEEDESFEHLDVQKEYLTPEMEEKIKALRDSERPVNILVVGPVGVGKSTLVNAMFGKDVAEVGLSARAFTTEVHSYEGEYNGVKIKMYDTMGFRDSRVKSYKNILLDIAKHGQFDLILICLKLGGRADRHMFLELASVLHKEMWKRTVVVLTFANQFETLESVIESKDVESGIKMQINGHKECVAEFLSKSVNKEVVQGIPFCLAGLQYEKKLTTVDDWLSTLWNTSITRSSDEALSLLSFHHQTYQALIELAGSTHGKAIIGAIIGALAGSVVPVVGIIIGAAIGAGVGASIHVEWLRPK
ncbi:PREDICTED: uncharacterized protein LOC109583126 isoform X1 [Amphimedon queenslandica]|uniref:G domain-containing protein n=1 Tax=Amphimedon queenslandica TaxID=400682 RepID=A0A1X7UIQ0_AMPQE|nr:PREDICTED: uncharacterized protein LOC109583126 isoform X1 [Amphimedon queenslandica]|eukprot:XP_019853880.1 PREDICTED: uncharacterized protein LOC109583126 isoform X1 [Amphimedon queenslandica]